ncbi:hypothetical protein SAMN05444365_103517 [Micromonospora pattaloongensis]|uniref:Uncharacterized protein n=1 Tax=Micromonospora pattaloongensis TaxID=405436 RepID=A0A1H3MTD1_9ACTN|nr:hypothetical protein [Micromonospora pattaloongensis]SDY79957.1 hypothetical protein SAMN05444365_103517 [Micromonospora pattaloongensis]
MTGTAKVIYGAGLTVTVLAVGLLDLFLIALLRSGWEQVASDGHRAYLTAVCGVLVVAGLALFVPFAFVRTWGGGVRTWVGVVVPIACALGALVWLVVGAVAAKVFGL